MEGCSHNVMWMRTGEVFRRRWKDVMGIVGNESGYVTHTYFSLPFGCIFFSL